MYFVDGKESKLNKTIGEASSKQEILKGGLFHQKKVEVLVVGFIAGLLKLKPIKIVQQQAV